MKGINAAYFIFGHFTCMVRNRQRVPKYVWEAVVTARQIMDGGAFNPLHIYAMEEAANTVLDKVRRKVESEMTGGGYQGYKPEAFNPPKDTNGTRAAAGRRPATASARRTANVKRVSKRR